jgi:alpha-tubulin suppressor-like RCC1 family protein
MHGGLVSCWGQGTFGRLGRGSNTRSLVPVAVVFADDSRLSSVAEITVGEIGACARTDAGAVYCWGKGNEGEIGDGGLVARANPTLVPGLSGVVSVSAGSEFVCAVQDDGLVLCWGANDFGQLGDGTEVGRSTPSAVWDL